MKSEVLNQKVCYDEATTKREKANVREGKFSQINNMSQKKNIKLWMAIQFSSVGVREKSASIQMACV